MSEKKKRLVVLDGYPVNPGDLSWQRLSELCDLKVYDRTTPEQLKERLEGVEMVLTSKVHFNEKEFNELPELKYVGVFATGYNVVDIEAATRHGVQVTNVPAYSTPSVCQMVFAHILNVAMPVQRYSDQVRAGRWCACEDFCYTDSPLMELQGKRLGVVGLGSIGGAVAAMAQAFGMEVLAFTGKPAEALPEGVRKCPLDQLFAESDVVSLHCPYNAQTHEVVNARLLSLMKPTAILVNTARGKLVCEQALADALNEGRIAAACLDVLSHEPPRADNPLLSACNCYITPHIAWATHEARLRLMHTAISNVECYIQGRPQNVVNR